MAKKPTGLGAFAARKEQPIAETEPGAAASALIEARGAARKGRAQGETVALTVRIKRSDWTRLHHLALSEGSSLQAIAVDGFSEVLKRHGLSPMTTARRRDVISSMRHVASSVA